MTEQIIDGTIKLDWYKDYPIQIQPSCMKLEEYSDGSKVPNVTFAFSATASWYSPLRAKDICTMFEQMRLYLLLSPDAEIQFKTFVLPIKKESEPAVKITEELLDDWNYEWRLDSYLKAALRTFNPEQKIIYQTRADWTYKFYTDVPQDYKPGPTVRVRGRFEFAILPKDAKRIINI